MVGIGRETCFWSDTWLNEDILANKFKRLWRIELNKTTKVSERMELVWGECRWKWERRREPRGWEVGELESVTSLLQEWSLAINGNNKLKWILSPNGDLSVSHLNT